MALQQDVKPQVPDSPARVCGLSRPILVAVLATFLSACGGGNGATAQPDTVAKAADVPLYTFVDLGALELGNGFAAGINSPGQVVGYSYATLFEGAWAYIWNGTTATHLVNPAGGTYAEGLAIDDAGQIVGYTSSADNRWTYATIWNGATPTILGDLGGTESIATGINSSGQVVGYSRSADNLNAYAVIWNGVTPTALDSLGGGLSRASGINELGQIVGYSFTAGGAQKATSWSGVTATATDLGTLGGTHSAASGINDAGQVVGYSYITGDAAEHATLWNGGTTSDLGTLGGVQSAANAINNAGQVVGYSDTTGGAQHAVVWNGAVATDLNTSLSASMLNDGWYLQTATGINNGGAIVGTAVQGATATHVGGITHAFVLYPVHGSSGP
jgi:probable HAF family extracellular repeat protein